MRHFALTRALSRIVVTPIELAPLTSEESVSCVSHIAVVSSFAVFRSDGRNYLDREKVNVTA